MKMLDIQLQKMLMDSIQPQNNSSTDKTNTHSNT
jgi:hypothetical protein